jgi:hypothetical protein
MVQEWNAVTGKFESVQWDGNVVKLNPAPNLNYPREEVVHVPSVLGVLPTSPTAQLVGDAIPPDSAFTSPPKCKTLTFLDRLEQLYREAVEIARKKNADYANEGDPFANFNVAPLVGVSVERGILVRTMDKIQRASNLLDRPAQVTGESIHDTLLDACNYLMILRVLMEMKAEG